MLQINRTFAASKTADLFNQGEYWHAIGSCREQTECEHACSIAAVTSVSETGLRRVSWSVIASIKRERHSVGNDA